MTLSTGNKGFTLIEVMVSVVILSIGTLMIQEGMLRSVDLFNRHSNTLKAELWMDRKISEVEEDLFFAEFPALGNDAGAFTRDGRPFNWSTVSEQSPEGKNLFRVQLTVSWLEAGRPRSTQKQIYAFKPPALE